MGDVAILRRFAALCGGEKCRVAIIPTASMLSETGGRYEQLFRDLGVKHAQALPIAHRNDCERREWLDVLDQGDGGVLTRGNQLPLRTMIGGAARGKGPPPRKPAGVHRG